MRYCRTPKGHSSILVYYSIIILQYLQAFYSIYKHSTVLTLFILLVSYCINCITLFTLFIGVGCPNSPA